VTGPYVAVCGPSAATEEQAVWAEETGRRLAEAGAIVVCGGLGGVMDAVARGASEAGGMVIGILPGETRAGASRHLTMAIPTGMGEARNALIARAADAVIAVGGEWGTLSEIALARKMGKPVVGLRTWNLARNGEGGLLHAPSPQDAVRLALEAANGDPR
jgi:uncharacterized protein (TIGR00725 family)